MKLKLFSSQQAQRYSESQPEFVVQQYLHGRLIYQLNIEEVWAREQRL